MERMCELNPWSWNAHLLKGKLTTWSFKERRGCHITDKGDTQP